MSQDFEKLDKEMMEKMKNLREQKMPEGLLWNFGAQVERKILARQARPTGMGLGWASLFAAGLAFLLFGVAVWKLLPARPRVVPVPVTASVTSIPAVSAPVILRPKAEESTRDILRSAPAEIVNEIEALKEIGVWTDEDEEKIGIALEETFDELELAFEDNTVIPAEAGISDHGSSLSRG